MSLNNLSSSIPEVGTRIGRFILESVDRLEEYQSFGLLFREENSGCEIYHVVNEDEENLFSYNFKTIPEDSSGVAHILEHTVLCGSEKYPVKDPFVMLYKGSMQTFLNAMTYPDKTLYPASSTVPRDLFNLMSVYTDAVFFPLLKEDHFRQEGHRLEKNPEGEIEITGVVYNEMKANYSTHDDIASDHTFRTVFPDTPYAFDSGGDPAEIPNLRYSYFLDFHRRYYHPSNCRIFLYGNIPSRDYLDFLDRELFSRFSPDALKNRGEVEVPLQKTWDAPKSMEVSYPASADEPGGGATSVNLTWLLGPVSDRKTALAVELLSDVLLGNPASPIQKLINESDLGEDLSSTSGYENEFRQMLFSVGMRGTKPERAQAVEDLIMGGLRDAAENGIHPSLLEGSLRRFEFRSREIKGGGPFGLRLLSRSMRSWLHGEQPRHSMDFAPVLQEVKAELETNPRYLQDLIRELLLDNTHRCRLTVYPDSSQNERESRAERESVDAKLAALGKDGENIVGQWTEEFARFQGTPDTPEAIASLPFLTVEDIPAEVRSIPNSRHRLDASQPLYYHEVFTNGISYVDLGFSISDLPPEYQLFVPLLTHMLPQIGSTSRSYEEVNLDWGLKTGGFSAYGENSSTVEKTNLQHCYLRLKTLDDMSDQGIDLVGEVTRSADFQDLKYLWELFSEFRNDMRSGIVQSGTNYPATRVSRALNSRAYVDDIWRGVIQQRFLEALHQLAMADRSSAMLFLSSRLRELADWIFSSDALIANVTCEAGQFEQLRAQVSAYAASLSSRSAATLPVAEVRGMLPEIGGLLDEEPAGRELIIHSTKVNFTAMALRASHLREREQVAELILAHILRTGLLWEKIRMEGGAYGAFAVPDGLSGLFVFGSYRDPAIEKSWAAYAESLEIIAAGALDQQTLDLAKIAIAGKELRPLSPAEQGLISFKREKYGISDELRQQRRRWLIGCTLDDVLAAAKRLSENCRDAVFAVLADGSVANDLAARYPDLRQTAMH